MQDAWHRNKTHRELHKLHKPNKHVAPHTLLSVYFFQRIKSSQTPTAYFTKHFVSVLSYCTPILYNSLFSSRPLFHTIPASRLPWNTSPSSSIIHQFLHLPQRRYKRDEDPPPPPRSGLKGRCDKKRREFR